MNLKLGKLPPVEDKRDLKFSDYLVSTLKPAPVGYGHASLVKNDWGMLGNDYYGDCTCAGAAHRAMVWNAAGGRQISFKTQDVLGVYSAVTGFDPNDPSTDQGAMIRDVLKYCRNTGMKDANGVVHKIGAYVSIDAKDFKQLLQALYLFEVVEIGFEVPAFAMDQFNDGDPWVLENHNTQIEGGHDVPIVGRPNAEGLQVVTWGQIQKMGKGFYEKYNDEAWAIISPEMLNNGISLEGFNLQQLTEDLAKI